MSVILRLEDYSFYKLLNNFEKLIENDNFVKKLRNDKIPLNISNRLFNELDNFYCGIPCKLLKTFKNDYFQLNNITFRDRNILDRYSIRILNEHRINYLCLKQLNKLYIDNILDILNCKEIIHLKLNQSIFLMEKELYDFRIESVNDASNWIFVLKRPFPLFTNLIVLNLSKSKIDNNNFFYLSKNMILIEDLNISYTNINDLRILKRFKKLKSLFCMGMTDAAHYNFIHIHCLKSLQYVSAGYDGIQNDDLIINSEIEPFIVNFLTDEELDDYVDVDKKFSSKTDWTFKEFFSLVKWKDLKFFNFTTDCELDSSSFKYILSI